MGLINQTPELYYLGADDAWNSGDENYGDYQFISIKDIINNFMVAYVGQDKLITKVKRTDVAYWAQRAVQEFSFDLLPQTKSIEIEVPPGLYMVMPQDFVSYIKLAWSDEKGIERIIYRTDKTSNPEAILQDSDFAYTFSEAGELLKAQSSETLKRFKTESSANSGYWDINSNPDLMALYAYGGRYGISPQEAQGNGVFYLDNEDGVIRFSSDLRGRIITLRYVSDGLGTEEDMNIHKYAMDAVEKYIAYSVLSTRSNVQEYLVTRFKKESSAARRNAKIRLSKLNLEQLSQVFRNQTKWIKH